jgi:hypothetical protein
MKIEFFCLVQNKLVGCQLRASPTDGYFTTARKKPPFLGVGRDLRSTSRRAKLPRIQNNLPARQKSAKGVHATVGLKSPAHFLNILTARLHLVLPWLR